MAKTIADYLHQTTASRDTKIKMARVDIACLLCHVLKVQPSHLYTYPEKELSFAESGILDALIQRRQMGEPIAYLVGQKEFWGLMLEVTSDVLIPRPETELLVRLALDRLQQQDKANLLDLGTGSGAIALAVASEPIACEIMAVDYSAAAIAVAKRNAKQLGLKSIEFIESYWYSAVPNNQQYTVITANPPYISEAEPHWQQDDCQYEPKSALVSDKDGLADIEIITKQASQYLRPNGTLLLEHGYEQAAAVQDLLGAAEFSNVQTHQDLAGLDRVTEGFWTGVVA